MDQASPLLLDFKLPGSSLRSTLSAGSLGSDQLIQTKRKRGSDRAQARVLRASVLTALFGCVLIGVGTFTQDPTGGFALVGGVVITISALSATTADLDINAFLAHKQWVFACVLLVYLMASAYMGIFFTPIDWVMIVPFLYAVVRFKKIVRMAPGFPLFTQLMTSFLACGAFGMGCNYLQRVDVFSWMRAPQFLAQSDQSDGPSIAISSVYFAGVPFCVLMHVSWSKKETPTVRMYNALYAWLCIQGMAAMVTDICSRAFGYHYTQFSDKRRPLDVLSGPFYFLFPSMMVCFRSRLHGRLGRRWARQRMRDGAEIAYLLEHAMSPECGMDYWLHRPDICDDPECLDLKCSHPKCSSHHQRMPQVCECQFAADGRWPQWAKGEIVAVEETSFTVEVRIVHKVPVVDGQPAHKQLLGGEQMLTDGTAPKSSSSTSTSSSSGTTSTTTNTTTMLARKKIPAKSVLTAEQILVEGGRQLQCVRASLITYERLSQGSGKSNIEELAEKGEPGMVDFFVSHSWHDDKETKFREWGAFFADFERENGRDAKCWLDEIIINQGNIEDSLKCLPVYLMACKKVLVLCGDTYCDRLWCIWELYTLFALSEYWEDALNRVQIIDLATNGSIADKLATFRLEDARCYNPNDQRKIREAIEAGPGGVKRFTELVRKIGADLAEESRQVRR
jgi:hypothetical protein